MSGEDVNRVVLRAVLDVIESWWEQDRASVALANGLITQAERTHTSVQAHTKHDRAIEVLARRLPRHAHGHLSVALQALAPPAHADVGDAARRWARPDRRLAAARDLLIAAHRAEREAPEHEARARAKAEREAERRAAEEERRTAEAEAAKRRRVQQRVAESERRAAEAVAAVQARRQRRAQVAAQYRSEAEAVLREDFLGADGWFHAREAAGLVTWDDFVAWKTEFVRRWVHEVLGDEAFDSEQARAVATTSSHLRVVARAGSGKTRVLVNRALFLQRHCGVAPGEITLVAFNRKAVDEITARIRRHLPPDEPTPHIVTFHALAYALLRPEEELVYDDEDDETHIRASKVQGVVNDLLTKRTDEVRRAMLGFFRDDWETLVQRGLHQNRDEVLTDRSEVTRVTLGGEWVKSYGERLIANILFEHDVAYKYERNHTAGGFNYRPDFTITRAGEPVTVIEYFGRLNDPEYQRNAEKKRAYWRAKPDVRFLELVPSQIPALGEEGFRTHLLTALDQAGIANRRLSEDEIWQRTKKHAINTFGKALARFVGRARKLDLNADDLRERVHTHATPNPDARDFLDLAIEVYETYLNRSRDEGFEDFDGMMWRAADHVRAGQTTWTRAGGNEHGDLRSLRFIHIDEFQDFSAMFMNFVQAIRTHAPRSVVCCVGDDWQAINGFAGADLTLYNNFDSDFPGSVTQRLVTNFRSRRDIVTAGNNLMDGNGPPADSSRTDPGSIYLARLSNFTPSPSERRRFPQDRGTPALLRLIKFAMQRSNGPVSVLLRRTEVPWPIGARLGTFERRLDGYLAHLRTFLPEDEGHRLDLTTTHKYKGREADFVIVADADAKTYPLVHPTLPLFEVFGDSIDSAVEAERRLFYVATTRAEDSLCYLVTTEEESPFLRAAWPNPATLQWSHLPEAVKGLPGQVEIRIYDGYEISETLKNHYRFEYEPELQYWYTYRLAAGFDFEEVTRELAFAHPRLIEVRDESCRVIHRTGTRLDLGPRVPPF